MVIFYIYGALAISLLFFNHQYTESESRDMEIGVARPIFTHKNIRGSMGQQYIYHTRWEKLLCR